MRSQRQDSLLIEGDGARIIIEINEAGAGPVHDFLITLGKRNPNELNKIRILLEKVAEIGPQNIHNTERVKNLKGGLFEFKSSQVRIFWMYGTTVGRQRTVVLLDGVVKKQNKHRPQDMNRARQHVARRQKEGKS